MHQLIVVYHVLEIIKEKNEKRQIPLDSTLVFIVSPQPTTPTHNVSHLGGTSQLT